MQKQRIKAKVADLILNEGQLDWLPENPRQWTREDLELTKASLLRDPDFQEDNPLKVVALPDGKLLVFAGNLRTSAAREVKWKTFEAMLYTPEGPEDEETIRRRALLDNGSFGSWDYDRLADKWSDMPFKELGIKVWDAPQEETPAPAQAQEDDFDETADAVETRCKTGDIWALGEHRLMCGDSTDSASVALLMNGERADVTFTSPPYNGNNELGSGDCFKRKGVQRLYAEGYSDDLPSADYVKFASSVLALCFEHTEGFIFWNVNYNSNSKYEYIQQIVPFLPNLIEQVVWKKSSAIPLKGCMRRAWEPVYIFSNTRKNLGTENVETNIWEISNTHANGEDHKACFPVGLPAKGISLVKPKSGIVLDPFGGTGTTMIAAEQLGRKCFMMELDPHYCDVILARWEKLTGQTAHKID